MPGVLDDPPYSVTGSEGEPLRPIERLDQGSEAGTVDPSYRQHVDVEMCGVEGFPEPFAGHLVDLAGNGYPSLTERVVPIDVVRRSLPLTQTDATIPPPDGPPRA